MEFALAEKLGRTVAELRATISNEEFVQWQVFWGWRKQLEEMQAANG
jgi:hypothetical protein